MNEEQDTRPPLRPAERPPRPARRARHRILRSTALLPALATILNGLSGFAAIHFATVESLGDAKLTNLTIAAWMIFLAMFFDMLDGRLARMTRRTSDFGGQLDSLCDMISFGVAPAVLMVRTVFSVLQGNVREMNPWPAPLSGAAAGRVVWCLAAVYMSCAALRLARFNVENEPDESAHRSFRGLPSPGAAATVAALVIFFNDLAGHIAKGLTSNPWLLGAVGVALPVVTLLCGLLMVSRFRYPHLVNQYIRGRRPFSYLVKLLIILPAALLYPFGTAAVLTLAYVFSGPVGWLWRRVRRSRQHATPA